VISAFLVQSVHLLHFLLALSAGLVTLLLFTLTFLLVCWLANSRRVAAGLKWFQICRSGDQSFNGKTFTVLSNNNIAIIVFIFKRNNYSITMRTRAPDCTRSWLT